MTVGDDKTFFCKIQKRPKVFEISFSNDEIYLHQLSITLYFSHRFHYLQPPEPAGAGSDGHGLLYTYDAAGVKLTKTVVRGNDTTVTRYQGPLVFENDTLQFIRHAEGRAVADAEGDGFIYQYFLKDHLGNVRVSREHQV